MFASGKRVQRVRTFKVQVDDYDVDKYNVHTVPVPVPVQNSKINPDDYIQYSIPISTVYRYMKSYMSTVCMKIRSRTE